MTNRFFSRWLGAALLAAGLALAPVAGSPAEAAPRDALAAKAGLDRAADTRPASVTGWYVDPAAKSLVVEVHGSAEGVTEWAAEHGAGPVTVAHVAETPRPVWDLISGQRIYSGSTTCTLGFNAYSGATRYVLAAGHCVAAGSSWYGVGGYIGPAVGSSFPGDDYGLIRVASASAASTALVDRYSAGSDVTIIGLASPTVGQSVCYSSPVSGWQCGGTITGTNQTICYPQGCVYGLARSSLCPAPGASGAPVVTNPGSGTTVRAVGMLSGGSGNCSSGGTSYIQLLAEPLAAYGLTLVTG